MRRNILSAVGTGFLAIICAVSACNSGKSRAKGTGDIKDPNTVCALLDDLNFDTGEYKKMSDNDYFCSGANASKVFYQANGDLVGVQQIRISVLPEAKAEDAAKNAETVAQAVSIIWQKLLGQSLPEEIKQAILKGSGDKTFSQPLDVKVSQSSPKLDVTIYVPDAEKLAALRKMQSKPVTSGNSSTAVTSGLKAPEPCGYLQKSMDIAAGEYKAISGEDYGCEQEKKLAGNSTFRYQAFGNQALVNALELSIYISPQSTEDQKQEMKKLIVLAANDVAAAAGGAKLSDDAIAASVSGETKQFAPATSGTNDGKPPIKEIIVSGDPSGDQANRVIIRKIAFKF